MVSRAKIRMILFALSIFALEADVHGQQLPQDLVLERFSAAKGGDAVLVPVNINGRKYNFLLDTGATRTACDNTLQIGKPRGEVQAATPTGKVMVKLFDLSDAMVGKLRFSASDPVAALNLKPFQEVSGHQIDGLLGLDFLNGHIVQIDFDRGEVQFLKSVPKDSAEVSALSINSVGCLQLSVNLAGDGKKEFMIDTGCGNFGYFDTDTMDGLLSRKVLQVIGRSKSLTASGISRSRTTRGRQLTIGDLRVANPVFDEAKSFSALGLRFWSRFVVTIDFPAQKLYLRKGAQYDRPERPDSSGLHILRKGETAIVHSVDPESPGASAGIRAGDILAQAGSFRAGEATLFQLRAALREPGTVPCVIRRDKTDSRVTLTIPDWSKTPFGDKPK